MRQAIETPAIFVDLLADTGRYAAGMTTAARIL
jgi:hypothetical protein